MKQSPLISQLIDAFRRLPSIGPKTAQRLSYHLLEHQREAGLALADALNQAIKNVHHCQQCQMLSEQDICGICADPKRQRQQICVVEKPSDLLAIESSGAYQGLYFVLLGRLSPLDGIGPEALGMDKLQKRLPEFDEMIIATNATAEGEATAHYLRLLAEDLPIKVSRLASGIPMGGELDYLDGSTLARSLSGRQPML